jgi:hypothetical protein
MAGRLQSLSVMSITQILHYASAKHGMSAEDDMSSETARNVARLIKDGILTLRETTTTTASLGSWLDETPAGTLVTTVHKTVHLTDKGRDAWLRGTIT